MTIHFNVSKKFSWNGPLTDRAAALMKVFGLTVPMLRDNQQVHECDFSLDEGQICFITGPSGSGKSVLFDHIYQQAPAEQRIRLSDFILEDDKPIVDCFDRPYIPTLRLLSTAGLADAFTLLSRPVFLSEGQKYRYRLARALASGRRWIFADEFCTGLDRLTASAISCKVRRFATARKVSFILASSHDDIAADLAADVTIHKPLTGKAAVKYRCETKSP